MKTLKEARESAKELIIFGGCNYVYIFQNKDETYGCATNIVRDLWDGTRDMMLSSGVTIHSVIHVDTVSSKDFDIVDLGEKNEEKSFDLLRNIGLEGEEYGIVDRYMMEMPMKDMLLDYAQNHDNLKQENAKLKKQLDIQNRVIERLVE